MNETSRREDNLCILVLSHLRSIIGSALFRACQAIRPTIGMTQATATAITTEQHPGHRWMLEALKLARNALDNQEVPSRFSLCSSSNSISTILALVGCVIVHEDTKIIASGQNQPVQTQNATRHAEICALDTLYAQYDLSTVQKVSSFSLLLDHGFVHLETLHFSYSVNPFSMSLANPV